MASAYGIVHNYGEPQSTFDAGLAMQALQYKQQKYDANAIKIEQTLNQFGIQMNQLVRPEDREHLYQNVNKLVNNIQGLDGADLGKRGVTQGIIGHVNQALDERTIQQLGNSAKIRNFQSQVQTIQQENPEQYNPLNYQAAVSNSGLQEYMSGESDTLGNLNYTPYNNYQEEVLDRIKKAKDVIGSQTVEFVDPNDPTKIITKKTDDMTVSEWMQYMPNFLTSQNVAQMRIEGAAQFGFNNEAAINSKESMMEATVTPLRQKLKNIDTKLNYEGSQLTDYQKKRLKAERAVINSKVTQVQTQFNNIGNTAEEIGGYIKQQNFITDMANLVGSDPSILIDKNQAYFDSLEKTKAIDPTTTYFATSDLPIGEVEDVSVEDFERQAETVDTNYERGVRQVYNQLDSTLKRQVDEDLVPALMSEKDMSLEEAQSHAIQTALKNRGERGDLETINDIETLRRQRDNYNKVVQNTYEKVNQEILWEGDNGGKIYDALLEEGLLDNITINGVSTRDYLESRGIENKDQFVRFMKTPEAKELQETMFTDVLLGDRTETGMSFAYEITKPPFTTQYSMGPYGAPSPAIDANTEIGKKTYHYVRRLSNILGKPEEGITDVLLVRDAEGNEVMESEVIDNIGSGAEYNITLREGNETSAVIRNRLEEVGADNYSAGGRSAFVDRQFFQDRDIRNILSYENYEKEFKETINTERLGVITPRKLTYDIPMTSAVAQKDTSYREIRRAASNSSNPAIFDITPGSPPVEIYQDPSDEDQYIISQIIPPSEEQITEAQEDNETLTPQTKQAHITKTDFQNLAPNLSAKINTDLMSGQIAFDVNEDVNINKITFPQNTPKRIKQYTSFLGNPTIANSATLEGAQSVLNNSIPDVYSNNNAPVFRDVFNYILRNPNKLQVNFEKRGEEAYVNVMANVSNTDTPDYELVKEIDVSNLDMNAINKTLNVAPQSFVTQALVQLGIDIRNLNGRISEEHPFNKIYQLYLNREQQ